MQDYQPTPRPDPVELKEEEAPMPSKLKVALFGVCAAAGAAMGDVLRMVLVSDPTLELLFAEGGLWKLARVMVAAGVFGMLGYARTAPKDRQCVHDAKESLRVKKEWLN